MLHELNVAIHPDCNNYQAGLIFCHKKQFVPVCFKKAIYWNISDEMTQFGIKMNSSTYLKFLIGVFNPTLSIYVTDVVDFVRGIVMSH